MASSISFMMPISRLHTISRLMASKRTVIGGEVYRPVESLSTVDGIRGSLLASVGRFPPMTEVTLDTSRQASFDPITLDMLWQRLITVMNEVDQIIVRTTFSTILSEGRDFACILTDRHARSLC